MVETRANILCSIDTSHRKVTKVTIEHNRRQYRVFKRSLLVAQHGWTMLFYTDFQLQWEDLTAKVVKLKSKLDPQDFVTHPDVKLLKAIDSGIRDKISCDPFARMPLFESTSSRSSKIRWENLFEIEPLRLPYTERSRRHSEPK